MLKFPIVINDLSGHKIFTGSNPRFQCFNRFTFISFDDTCNVTLVLDVSTSRVILFTRFTTCEFRLCRGDKLLTAFNLLLCRDV